MLDLKAIRFILGTKVSHDYQDDIVKTFSYRELIEARADAIGIPCYQNKIFVVDVDVAGATHKVDGREWWMNFVNEYGVPPTYTVRSPSGGYHFYFRLPEAVDPDQFFPPNHLAPGVDIKYRGWVGAPPTAGYSVHSGNVATIQIAPPSLMMYISGLVQGRTNVKTFDGSDPRAALDLHRPFTPEQIRELNSRMDWLQTNGDLSRAEWRDGLFALKAGVDDPQLLDELVVKWSMNKSYVPGDEEQARSIVAKADKHGPIGPGSIFNIIGNVVLRSGAPIPHSPWTSQEILDRSKVKKSFDKTGGLKIEASESNVAALLGAIYDDKTLYHDSRLDLYIYQGKSHSDDDLVNKFLPVLQTQEFGLGLDKFRKPTVKAGLDVLMAQRKRDPHREYLESLRWDGISRVERFFIDYVGAEDCDYIRLVGKNFWTAMAARGLNPGAKFDTMVVIEGDEGIAKSSLVKAIGGQYTNAPSDKKCFQNLDRLREMHQAIIVELPELIGIIGMDDNTVKNFLAQSEDHIRPLFAKRAMLNPRGFVFVGTTNDTKYLTRGMGHRRFWPVRVPSGKTVKRNAILTDRDQLFAEAIHLYREGHQYYHMPKELLDPVVQCRVVDEPLMSPIKDVLSFMGPSFTTTDIYIRLESMGLVVRGLNMAVVSRIESSLFRLGCEQFQSGGISRWRLKEDKFTPFMMSAQNAGILESFI